MFIAISVMVNYRFGAGVAFLRIPGIERPAAIAPVLDVLRVEKFVHPIRGPAKVFGDQGDGDGFGGRRERHRSNPPWAARR